MPSLSIDQALQIAQRHHEAGRLRQAEAIYRQVLDASPNHAEALHLLGVVAHQLGEFAAAADLMQRSVLAASSPPAHYFNNLGSALRECGRLEESINAARQAIALKGDYAVAYNNLGNALADLGRLEEAAQMYRAAVKFQSQYLPAYSNLGNTLRLLGRAAEAASVLQEAIQIDAAMPELHCRLGDALRDLGRLDEAIASYGSALNIDARYPDAHCNLGTAMYMQGRLEEAAGEYQAAIELNPKFVVAHSNLGNTLRELGRLEEAEKACRAALGLRPDYAIALNNLGNVLSDQGRSTEAMDAYRAALRHDPGYFVAHSNLGNTLQRLGRLTEALAAHQAAISLNPQYAEAHNNLANVLCALGRREEAIAAFGTAISLRPSYAQAYNNMGTALSDLGRLDEAIAAYRQSLRIQPDFAQACTNLGNVLKDQGFIEEAIQMQRQAIKLNPGFSEAHDNLLYALHFHPSGDAAAIAREHAAWAAALAAPLAPSSPTVKHPAPNRPLRIGYVSPDLRDHPVGRFMLPILENHDRDHFGIYCYSDTHRVDDLTRRLRQCSTAWLDSAGLSDEALAQRIAADQIDILVDLALHSAYNRMLVFARKPAPVQITYLGYPSTTGLPQIDYRLTDPHLDPPDSSLPWPEKPLHLPSYFCYQPPAHAPAVGDLPAAHAGHITFGCLNNFAKLSDPALEVFASLLASIPDSRLILHCAPGTHRQRVEDALARQAVVANRVTFLQRQRIADYFQSYNTLDIALDPFPYNGGATTCDALYMGVPVVTLARAMPVGRAGVSIVNTVGLGQLIAQSTEEYIRIAAELARDLPRLRELRSTLRQQVLSSPLCDAIAFTRALEERFRQVAALAPASAASAADPGGMASAHSPASADR